MNAQAAPAESDANGAKGQSNPKSGRPYSKRRGVMAMIFEGSVDPAADAATIAEHAIGAVREQTGRRGLETREEAEFLFTLDRLGRIGGPEWMPVAVKALRDFVVWESRPTGHVTEADVDWLMGLVGDRPTAFGRAVVFAIVQEADAVPPRLAELAMRAHVGRCLLV
jgi:hypothetical protein